MQYAHNNSTRQKIFFLAYRYANHAGRSGYDRFADYLGEPIHPSAWLRFLGENVLRIPAKIASLMSGCFEYSRHDYIRELAVRNHMRNHSDGIYHFLYAEKSFRYISRQNGRNGNRIVGSFHHCPFKYKHYFRSTKHFSSIDHAVVVSTIQIDHLEKIVGKGNVTMVPYAVDADYFKPRGFRGNHPVRCICIGQHLRDYEALKQIIPKVRLAFPELEFYVIGANPEFDSMKYMPGVVYRKEVPDREYLEILRQSDLLVLPLRGSTSVTTVNEALACGIPVITSRGGISDYLNEQCAVQHEVGDIDGMICTVIELLRDERRRQLMSLAARQRGEELHWPNSADIMRKVYDKLT
jgi:glycosyltransferase involved in cell wall biosynthesis